MRFLSKSLILVVAQYLISNSLTAMNVIPLHIAQQYSQLNSKIQTLIEETDPDFLEPLLKEPYILEREPGKIAAIENSLSKESVYRSLKEYRIKSLKKLMMLPLSLNEKRLLVDLELDKVMHELGPALGHFIGTYELLVKWGADRNAALGGLLHAVYGTEFNTIQMLDAKNLEHRSLLRKAVGHFGERFAFLFGRMQSKQFFEYFAINIEKAKNRQPIWVYDFEGSFPYLPIHVDKKELELLAMMQIAKFLETIIAQREMGIEVNISRERVEKFEPLLEYLPNIVKEEFNHIME